MDRADVIAVKSQALHGNKFVLPVAIGIVELGSSVVKAAEIRDELKGTVPENRIHEGLRRLCAMGVLTELPYPGRPSPKLFERCPSAYWDFVVPFVAEHLSSNESQ
jgi:hypothetical protein